MNWFASLFRMTDRTSSAGQRIETALEGIAASLETVDAGLRQQFGLPAPEAVSDGTAAVEGKKRNTK